MLCITFQSTFIKTKLRWTAFSGNLYSSQEYLLTPMDRGTLFNAKSTISHCTPSLITRQRASVDCKLL